MPRCPSGHFDASSASAWLCRRFAQAKADPDTVVYSAEVESQPTVVGSAEVESQPTVVYSAAESESQPTVVYSAGEVESQPTVVYRADVESQPTVVCSAVELDSQPAVVYSAAEVESQPSSATAPMNRRKKKSQRLRRQARKPRTDEDDLWDYMLLTEFEHDILDGEVTCPGCGSLLQCRRVTPGRTPCPACGNVNVSLAAVCARCYFGLCRKCAITDDAHMLLMAQRESRNRARPGTASI